ncbi:MAG TPA: hypothetical protein VFF33_01180 [Ignavibacteriaceae bacterium]|nr:hypothetical protein [Ignavibacteriaceae bacterium]
MKIFFLILFLSAGSLFPQQSTLSKNVNSISEYLASKEFNNLNCSDLEKMDYIYENALRICGDDETETLLALTFACVPYNRVHLRVPLLNAILVFPLISASDSIFLMKNKSLPRRLFIDSPTNDYGDMDKPAHFFGSAFVAHSESIFDFAFVIGYFVEAFEESFEVQNQVDYRDIRTNQLGAFFGRQLKCNSKLKPSQVLSLYSLNLILL